MRRVTCLIAVAALLAVVAGAAQPAVAGKPAVAAKVKGGGTADFQDTPNAVNTTGFTEFSVAATVFTDGSAHGHFMCQVPGIVIITGNVESGTANANGSVTIEGRAFLFDHTIPMVFVDLPFTTTLRAGGPGVGGFDFREESGFFGPGQFDTELVRRGMIRISD